MERQYTAVLVLLLLVVSDCRSPTPIASTFIAQGEAPLKVTACQIIKDPVAYNHKLVEVSGRMSFGFEDFSLYPDEPCKGLTDIWLDLGGTANPAEIYCCGNHGGPVRPQQAALDGFALALSDDARTQRFVKIVQAREDAGGPTTLIGRFFAGEKQILPRGTFWGGYGHMGCCSLLVIQQVLD